MKIQITTDYIDERIPYRQLSVAAVTDAINRLSHDGLKLWLKLAMNKNGYTSDLEIDKSLYDELEPWLIKRPDSSILFSATGKSEGRDTDYTEQEQSDLPYEWRMISDDYGQYGKIYYDRIMQKISGWMLGNQATEILTYWHDNIDDVRRRRSEYEQKTCREVKSPLGYDLQIAAIRWAQDNFRFEAGDRFDMGVDFSKLRVRDLRMSRSLQMEVDRHNGQTKIEIAEDNITFWNRALEHDAFELPIEEYGRILTERKTQERRATESPAPRQPVDEPIHKKETAVRPQNRGRFYYIADGPGWMYEIDGESYQVSDKDGEAQYFDWRHSQYHPTGYKYKDVISAAETSSPPHTDNDAPPETCAFSEIAELEDLPF